MHVAIDADDVLLADHDIEAVDALLAERTASPSFAGARDLRLRLRRTKDALLVCVAAVGFAGGSLVTSRATSASPVEAMASALDELPARVDTMGRYEADRRSTTGLSAHAAARAELERLLTNRR